MPRTTSKKASVGGNRGISSLIAALQKTVKEDEVVVSTATQLYKELKWLPLLDPKSGLPSIALSWLIGCKGFPAGKISQLRAIYSSGKSSFLYYLYACALRGQTDDDVKAWVGHIETEGAPNPPDYISHFGLNPDAFAYISANSLGSVFSTLDQFVCQVRGGFGGSIGDTGRLRKTVFTDPLDATNKFPIILGVDSLSALGDKKEASQDVHDADKSAAMAYVSRELRRYMRDRQQRFSRTAATLFVTSLETTKVNTGPMSYGGPQKSALAQEALAGVLSFGVDMSDRKWMDAGVERGSIQAMKTFKNKFAPRWRTVDMFREKLGGYNIVETDVNFLVTHPESPFAPGQVLNPDGGRVLYRDAWGIHCPLLRPQAYKSKEEFIQELNANQDMFDTMLEGLRIRGYGFDFETNFDPDNLPDDDDDTEEPQGPIQAPVQEQPET